MKNSKFKTKVLAIIITVILILFTFTSSLIAADYIAENSYNIEIFNTSLFGWNKKHTTHITIFKNQEAPKTTALVYTTSYSTKLHLIINEM